MAREILGKENQTHRALRLNIGLEGYWKQDAINISRYMSLLPKGYDFLRADYSDLGHYFEPDSVDEIWLNADLPIEPALSLLKYGGKLHLSDGEVMVKSS